MLDLLHFWLRLLHFWFVKFLVWFVTNVTFLIKFATFLVCYIFGLVCYKCGHWPPSSPPLPPYISMPHRLSAREESQKKHSKTVQFISNSFLCKKSIRKQTNSFPIHFFALGIWNHLRSDSWFYNTLFLNSTKCVLMSNTITFIGPQYFKLYFLILLTFSCSNCEKFDML